MAVAMAIFTGEIFELFFFRIQRHYITMQLVNKTGETEMKTEAKKKIKKGGKY